MHLDPKIHNRHVFECKLSDLKTANQTKAAAGIDILSYNIKLNSKFVKGESFFGNKIAVDPESYQLSVMRHFPSKIPIHVTFKVA